MKVRINTSEFIVSGKHFPDFWRKVTRGMWEPQTFKVIKAEVEPGKTFVDLGAWNGVFSLYAATLGAQSFAVEPDPVAWAEIVKAKELNPSLLISGDQMAITGENGKVMISNNNMKGFGNSESRINKRNYLHQEEVESMTLATYFKNRKIKIKDVCLIKMDVEGSEVEIVKQAKDYLAKHKPTIHLSLHPAYMKKDELRETVETLFEIYKFIGCDEYWQEFISLEQLFDAIDNHLHVYLLKAR